MDSLDTKTKVAMLMMMYDGDGKLTKFQDDIYGFVKIIYNYDTYGFRVEYIKVNLLDLIHNTILDEDYKIDYIGEHILLLRSDVRESLYSSVTYNTILDRKTFEVLERSAGDATVVGNIITITEYGRPETRCSFYDMHGKKIYEITGNVAYDEVIVECANEEYYIVRYGVFNDSDTNDEDDTSILELTVLLKYDKTDINEPIKKIWESDKYNMVNIGHGLYALLEFGIENIDTIKVIDLVNLKEVVLDI